MRLVWIDEALADLEDIAKRAPRAADNVLDAVEWLVRFRPVLPKPVG